MPEDFCEVRFQVDDAVGRSVMYANGGSMLGGNLAFAHYGSYSEIDGVATPEITSHRHNDDPDYQSLLGSDIATIDGRWDGEILNQEHTPARSEHPIFGGYKVGNGFAGSCDDRGALLDATALAGKRSLRLTAVLKLMRPA